MSAALSAVLDETFLDTGERGPLRLLSSRALLVTWAHLVDPASDFHHQEILLARVEWEAKQRGVLLSLGRGSLGGIEARLVDKYTGERLMFPFPTPKNEANALERAAYFYNRTRERL